MNSAVVLALVGLLAGANAGFLASPAVVAAPVATSYSSGIIRGAPLVHAYSAPVAVKSVAYASPVAYAHGPVAYAHGPVAVAHAQPALVRVARSADPGVLAAPIATSYSSGIIRGAPLVHAYSAPVAVKSVAYASPVAYAHGPVAYAHGPVAVAHAQPALVRVARSADPGVLAAPAVVAAPAYHAPLVHAAPVAYASPFAYQTPVVKSVAYASPVAYSSPIVKTGPVFL